MSAKEAQNLATSKKMDLVKINPTAKPPVCKIMDYSKFKYDQAKRVKEAKKKQKTVSVKEVRLSPSIGDHDLDVKLKNCIKFLKAGDRVKVSIRFRGRELGHTEIAHKIFQSFTEKVAEYGDVEKRAKMEGRSMVLTIAPKTTN